MVDSLPKIFAKFHGNRSEHRSFFSWVQTLTPTNPIPAFAFGLFVNWNNFGDLFNGFGFLCFNFEKRFQNQKNIFKFQKSHKPIHFTHCSFDCLSFGGFWLCTNLRRILDGPKLSKKQLQNIKAYNLDSSFN